LGSRSTLSIAVDEVSFWHFIVGVLAVEGWAPSKIWRRFPSLLEELDFWPGAMVEVKGQPIEGRESSVKWEKVENGGERQGGTFGGTSFTGMEPKVEGCAEV